jgi:hypothetical protein
MEGWDSNKPVAEVFDRDDASTPLVNSVEPGKSMKCFSTEKVDPFPGASCEEWFNVCSITVSNSFICIGLRDIGSPVRRSWVDITRGAALKSVDNCKLSSRYAGSPAEGIIPSPAASDEWLKLCALFLARRLAYN